MAAKKQTAQTADNSVLGVEIQPMNVQRVVLTIEGDTPLIMHKWAEKARKEMLDKQMKKAKQGKEAKDPERDYRESMYTLADGRYGFPAVAFKAAAVGACRFADCR